MKSKTTAILVALILLLGGYIWYDHQQRVKAATILQQKIDEVLAQNTATVNGALDSYNFTLAQKDEQIRLLQDENKGMKIREKQLLEKAAQQEAAVQPILEQYPEVAQLVFTLKETISTLQEDNQNLQNQLSLTQENLAKAKETINTLVEQNTKLTVALEDFRGDLHKALSLTKKKSTLETVAEWSFRGLIVYGVVK